MRLGIRAKQIAGVTAIVGLSVVALSGLAVERICRFLLEESITRGKILALATYPRAREVVPASADPYAGLRDDPGLRKVAGPTGIVRREHFVLPSTTEKRLFDAKVFVLTSGATGSAAEHMTLALKHAHRATIIGEATAGAGHYGGLEPINEKFAVFIPVGRSFDPDTGKDWEGTGVAPDVDVPPAAALTEALVRSGLSRADAERINATVKPTGSMERRIPRRVAASN